MKRALKVLLVDDNDVTQFISQKTMEFSEATLNVVCCKNGIEALEFIAENISHKEKLPDLILLDLTMPLMDGWDFLEQYALLKRKIKKHIAVCILTSSINLDDMTRLKNDPSILDYIVKPMTIEKFTEIIAATKSFSK